MSTRARLREVRCRLAAARSDERGVSLVELAFVLLVMGILLAVTVPIVSTLVQTNSKVDVTYSNVDQQLWLSTTLQRLVRSAVAPDPSPTPEGTKAPIPAFAAGTLTPTAMTFYTNTGTSDGPVKITASCTWTTTHHTRCQAPTSTFTVTMTKAEAGTCPKVTGTYGFLCKYTPSQTHTLVKITHVKNGTKSPPQPLFVYSYGAQPPAGSPMVTTTVCAITTPAKTPSGCISTDTSTFGSCIASKNQLNTFEKCPAGEVEKVSYDLMINAKTTSRYGGEQAEDDTGIFVLSSASMVFDPSVG